MQVLFCHDGPLTIDNKDNIYGIAHNDEMFKRYFAIADKIAVAIRLKRTVENKKVERLSKIKITPFKIYEVPNISSVDGLFQRGKAKQIIKEAVLDSDYIVARLPSMIGNIAIDYAVKYNKPYI